MVCLLRYAQVIEHSHRCWVNTSALVSGCTNAVGLVMVGNFQVSALRPVLKARPPLDGSGGVSDASVCLSGGSRQVSPLRWSRGGVPSRPAVRVPAVCSHLPRGRHRTGLLDGSLPGGSGSGSYGVPCPQYPSLTSGTSSVQIQQGYTIDHFLSIVSVSRGVSLSPGSSRKQLVSLMMSPCAVSP